MAYGIVNADQIGTSVAGSNLGAGNASLLKNRLINGAMLINQRGSSVTSNGYCLDRWFLENIAGSKMTAEQSSTAPAGFVNSLLITSTTALSVSAGDYYNLDQRIEGYNVADLGFGTASAKTVTASFWVRSSLTGTFGGSLMNGTENRSYPFTFTISAANTWEQKTVTIAGDTSGTWATNSSTGMILAFNLAHGSDYQASAGAWTTGYKFPTGAVNILATNGATFYITGVQLEVGSSATGFEYVNYQTSLANCQRYYQFAGNGTSSTVIYGFPGNASSTFRVLQVNLPVAMRTAPTVTYTAGGGGTFGTFYSDANFFNALSNAGNTTSDNNIYGYKASAEL